MRTRWPISLVSLVVVGGAALIAPSADKAASDAKYQVVSGWPTLPGQLKLGPVAAVAADSEDRIFVFQRAKTPIVIFDKNGKFARSWGEGLIKTAHGLRIDRDGNVWLTDIGTHLVLKFDPEGKLLLTLGKKGEPGDTPDKFNKPTDVAVAANGDVFVSDGYGNSRVVKFSRDGKYLKEWGKKGTGEGEFNLPHAIFLDAAGRVCVGDRENNRIQVFDADGKFLTQWPESGAPFGLYLTKDRVLVADGRAHGVRILDLQGKPLVRWGEKGKEVGQLEVPHWICADSQGAIYVAEVGGQRVQKFVAK